MSSVRYSLSADGRSPVPHRTPANSHALDFGDWHCRDSGWRIENGRANHGQGRTAQDRRIGLVAAVALTESDGLTPSAGPAIEQVCADDRCLGECRGPIGEDVIGVIMGRVADRCIDCAGQGSLGNLARTPKVMMEWRA